jgi:hypothetical protein
MNVRQLSLVWEGISAVIMHSSLRNSLASDINVPGCKIETNYSRRDEDLIR